MLPLYVQFLEKVVNGEIKKSSLQTYSPSVASFKDIFMSVNITHSQFKKEFSFFSRLCIRLLKYFQN